MCDTLLHPFADQPGAKLLRLLEEQDPEKEQVEDDRDDNCELPKNIAKKYSIVPKHRLRLYPSDSLYYYTNGAGYRYAVEIAPKSFKEHQFLFGLLTPQKHKDLRIPYSLSKPAENDLQVRRKNAKAADKVCAKSMYFY